MRRRGFFHRISGEMEGANVECVDGSGLGTLEDIQWDHFIITF